MYSLALPFSGFVSIAAAKETTAAERIFKNSILYWNVAVLLSF